MKFLIEHECFLRYYFIMKIFSDKKGCFQQNGLI